VALVFAGLGFGDASAAHAKPFMDYLKPMPPVAPLTDATWGVAGVLPRDTSNGIESVKGKGVHPEFYYWDGQVIRAKDGKYHMFMSTFSGNTNFGSSWMTSDAYHAISETNPLGPYVRKDYVYTYNGKHTGHNVTAFEVPGGGYAVVVSENVRPFTLFKADSLDGPWTPCNPSIPFDVANVSIFPRHDGKFQLTYRQGGIAIADTLCGTYKKVQPKCTYPTANADTVYVKRTSIPGVTNPNFTWEEDPHIWYSAGTYHIIYSGSGDRVGYHIYSKDGINDWKDNGYGWSPREYKKIFCYEGSTVCNQWYKMERPSVVLENGHPTYATWAVSDVDKDNQVTPTSNSGTKVIVIPFDGEQFDKDFGDGSAGGSGGSTGTGGATGTAGSTGTGGARGGSTSSGVDGGVAVDGGIVGGNVTGGTTAAGGTTRSTTVSTGGGTSTGGRTSSTSGPSGGTSAGGNSSSASGGRAASSSSVAAGSSGSGGAKSSSAASSSSVEPATGGNSGTSSKGSNASTASADDSSGCGCSLGAASRGSALVPGLLLGALGMLLVRRRRRR
jgi:MYXO-CTERM domain-containing protein